MRLLSWMLVLVLGVALTSCSKKDAAEDDMNAVVEEVEEGTFGPGGSDYGQAGGLQTVHFAYDSYELSDEAKLFLDAAVVWLNENTDTYLQLEGHCDERGTIEYNMSLGINRANTVADYLVSKGLDRSRITTISYGEERPFVAESNEDAWAKNRRVNFVIVSQ